MGRLGGGEIGRGGLSEVEVQAELGFVGFDDPGVGIVDQIDEFTENLVIGFVERSPYFNI